MIRLERRGREGSGGGRARPEGLVNEIDDPIGDSERVPDQALVRESLRGEEGAFARLVRRYLRRAMAVALEYTGTVEDAEDVVQDAFRRVAGKLHTFDAGRPFGPWFFTIVRNASRNAVKAKRLRAHAELDVNQAAPGPGPFEEVRRREMRTRIERAVASLPPMQQTCFRMCAVEGLTSVEAAAATGLAESTVRVHVLHARRTLATLLEAWREEVEGA